MKQIKEGNGTAQLTTVEAANSGHLHDGKHIELKDEKGGTAMVTSPTYFSPMASST